MLGNIYVVVKLRNRQLTNPIKIPVYCLYILMILLRRRIFIQRCQVLVIAEEGVFEAFAQLRGIRQRGTA